MTLLFLTFQDPHAESPFPLLLEGSGVFIYTKLCVTEKTTICPLGGLFSVCFSTPAWIHFLSFSVPARLTCEDHIAQAPSFPDFWLGLAKAWPCQEI